MATLPFPGFDSVPLAASGTGAAFVLLGGDKPLQTAMRQGALAAQAAQRDEALKQKQREQNFKNFQSAKFEGKPFLPWANQLQARKEAFIDQSRQIWQDNSLDDYTKFTRVKQLESQWQGSVNRSNEVEQRLNQVRQIAAADKRYSKQATEEAFFKTFEDETSTVVNVDTYDPETMTEVLNDPRTFDRNAVATRFLDDLSNADTSTTSTAATPGRYGQRNTAESNLWEVENGVLKLDPATGRRIPRTNRPEVIEAARRDPFVSKLIEQQMQAQEVAVAGVVEKMKALQPLTAEEQQLVAQEQNGPKSYAQYLNELLLPHAYQRTSEIRTYARPIVPKTPKAAPKKSATEVTVTPTVGYQASSYTPEATGVGQRMKSALGITPARVTNHYPTVGVAFASARSPYAEVMVDNRGAQVVGQDGTTTTLAKGNGKVPMRVTSRDLALYINGKRIGRKEEFNSDTDAYAYLLSTIERLTPEQARKAELRAEYRGSITDKARTVNDGTGGQQQAPNSEPQGLALPFPPDGKRPAGGQAGGPTATEQSVIIQANQITDAQLQQASGNTWNPRKLTAEQTRAVEALKRKGGRLVSPYTQMSTTGQPTGRGQLAPLMTPGTDWDTPNSRPAAGSNDKYRKKNVVLRIGVPDPSRSELVGKKDVLGFGTPGQPRQ